MGYIDWSKIHQQEKSWRQQILGDAPSEYVLNRYFRLFFESFKGNTPLSFLELGSGNGDISSFIVNAKLPFVGRYVTSEYFTEGVEWLRSRRLDSLLLDAENINLPDESFDVVISFDVMHHVNNPQAMAHEMVRVSRGRLLLTEANGLSIGRKIMELAPGHKAAGERSYLPSHYLRFFSTIESIKITKINIYPFLFVLKTPPFLVKSVIALSRIMETVPFLRWQCATVCLDIEFVRLKKGQPYD